MLKVGARGVEEEEEEEEEYVPLKNLLGQLYQSEILLNKSYRYIINHAFSI
jgi:hypothetical protein